MCLPLLGPWCPWCLGGAPSWRKDVYLNFDVIDLTGGATAGVGLRCFFAFVGSSGLDGMDDESFLVGEGGKWKGRGIGYVYRRKTRDYNPIPPLSFSFSFPFLALVLVVSCCCVYLREEGRGRERVEED